MYAKFIYLIIQIKTGFIITLMEKPIMKHSSDCNIVHTNRRTVNVRVIVNSASRL